MPFGAAVLEQFGDGGVTVESAEAARMPLPKEHRNMQSFLLEHCPRCALESPGNRAFSFKES